MSSVQQNNSQPVKVVDKSLTRKHGVKLIEAVGNKNVMLIISAAIILIGNLALIGTIMFFMNIFYNCQSKTSENCPFSTCSVKDECENNSFFYNNGKKICMSSVSVFGPE